MWVVFSLITGFDYFHFKMISQNRCLLFLCTLHKYIQNPNVKKHFIKWCNVHILCEKYIEFGFFFLNEFCVEIFVLTDILKQKELKPVFKTNTKKSNFLLSYFTYIKYSKYIYGNQINI